MEFPGLISGLDGSNTSSKLLVGVHDLDNGGLAICLLLGFDLKMVVKYQYYPDRPILEHGLGFPIEIGNFRARRLLDQSPTVIHMHIPRDVLGPVFVFFNGNDRIYGRE